MPVEEGDSTTASPLTSGALQLSIKGWPLPDTRAQALDEVVAIMLIFKVKIPSLEWGSLPNCLVTKYVFAVVFTNSAPPSPVSITRNPVGLRAGPGFEIHRQQSSCLIAAPRGLLPQDSHRLVQRPSSLISSCASIASLPPCPQSMVLSGYCASPSAGHRGHLDNAW